MLNAVLEHPLLRQQVIPMTVHTYEALGQMGLVEERTELIRGFVLPKMSKSPRHYIVTQRLVEWLRLYLNDQFCIRQEQPIACSDSEPEPDIAVVAGGIEDFAQAHPTTATLIIEVSISTLERDREKAAIYAEAGVPEYWLVNPEAGWVEQFSVPLAGVYSQCVRLEKTDILCCLSFPGIQVTLSDLLA
jgi:Uma2 family endonuclease